MSKRKSILQFLLVLLSASVYAESSEDQRTEITDNCAASLARPIQNAEDIRKARADLTPRLQALQTQFSERLMGNDSTILDEEEGIEATLDPELSAIFERFNGIAAELKAPTPDATKNALVRFAARKALALLGKDLPQPAQAYLEKYEAKLPEFKLVRQALADSVKESIRRKDQARLEVERLEVELERIRGAIVDLGELVEVYKAQQTAAVDKETKDGIQTRLIDPILSHIRTYERQVMSQRTIVMSKIAIIGKVEEVIEGTLSAVNVTFPTIRNAAKTITDANQLRGQIRATSIAKEAANSAMIATGEAVKGLYGDVDRYRESEILDVTATDKTLELLWEAIEQSRTKDINLQTRLTTIKNSIKTRTDKIEKAQLPIRQQPRLLIGPDKQ